MSNLEAFLEDTKIALDNGFGKTESILRMFNALHVILKLHKAKPDEWNKSLICKECSDLVDVNYPCPTIEAIERELG